ncbi:MAG TPA: ATP-binding protein, partial [Thermoanaerobaculia bacterium]|nr:ATP-binding protein [Thermoanaerobaculia bacterium]
RPPETSGALATPPLSDIAGISRELVDSMSDIVWAINPEHDRMGNLVHRMRRFATDVLGGQGIEMRFVSSVADEDIKIGADVRRQIYLIFKESIHNIVRHSRARNVEVSLDGAGGGVTLRVADDGRGFDCAAEHEGHGLRSIRRRAAAMGGSVEVVSSAGRGTTVTATARLERTRPLSMLRVTRNGLFR